MQTNLPTAPTIAGDSSAVQPLYQLLIDAPDMASAEKQRRYLAPKGVRIITRKNLSGLGLVLSTFRLPDEVKMETLIQELADQFPDALIEPNRRHHLLFSKKKSYAQTMVGIPMPSQCQRAVSIAMLDSAVNTALPFLSKERVGFVDVTQQKNLSMQHGTAVAAIMVADGKVYPGLLPQAKLTAINVFALDEIGEPETRTDWLLFGLNQLTEIVPLPLAVNLSFGGDHSSLLERAVIKLSKSMVFVAAAGNDNSDRLVYPAAYPSVYAVGAVNAAGEKTRGSNYGNHIVMTAPGEDIWTTDGDGAGHYVTGTSFAAPFATAAIALAKASGQSADDFLASLGPRRLANASGLCR